LLRLSSFAGHDFGNQRGQADSADGGLAAIVGLTASHLPYTSLITLVKSPAKARFAVRKETSQHVKPITPVRRIINGEDLGLLRSKNEPERQDAPDHKGVSEALWERPRAGAWEGPPVFMPTKEQFAANPRSHELRQICTALFAVVQELTTMVDVSDPQREEHLRELLDHIHQRLGDLGIIPGLHAGEPIENFADPVVMAEYVAGAAIQIAAQGWRTGQGSAAVLGEVSEEIERVADGSVTYRMDSSFAGSIRALRVWQRMEENWPIFLDLGYARAHCQAPDFSSMTFSTQDCSIIMRALHYACASLEKAGDWAESALKQNRLLLAMFQNAHQDDIARRHLACVSVQIFNDQRDPLIDAISAWLSTPYGRECAERGRNLVARLAGREAEK
jgi:hypothetical protein